MAQGSSNKALSSNSSTTKKKKKRLESLFNSNKCLASPGEPDYNPGIFILKKKERNKISNLPRRS
jgi:hypothetical protein